MMSVVMAIPGTRLAQPLDKAQVGFRCVSAPHHLENAVRAALQRKMNVLDELVQSGEGAEEGPHESRWDAER